jgi:hypothetical protein
MPNNICFDALGELSIIALYADLFEKLGKNEIKN